MRWFDGMIARWLFCAVIIVLASKVLAGLYWRQVDGGIQYRKIIIEQKLEGNRLTSGTIHLLKINPLKYKLDIITAKQFGMTNIDAKTMASKTDAFIAINGGFFTPEYNSLGLLVQSGREINKIKWTSWWHIFQMNSFKPMIVQKQAYEPAPEIEMAIEAGPRLLIDGAVPDGLKPSSAERTALGITQDGQIIIAVTESYPVSLSEFARQLQDAGCHDALNLDGGSSTQLYAKIRGFELNRANLSLVANGIGVFPR